ncbi:MAG: carbohydrate-binding protein, partial [Flavisolibacter sp.]
MKHKTISVTGKLLLFLLSYCLFSKTVSAQTPNANSFSSYVAYNGTYRYGANPGYYGSNWNAENIATLAMGNASLGVKGAGVHSLRVPLYDDFLSQWGLTTELSKFQNYTSMGGGDFTAFIGSPSAAHREPTTFPGSPEQAKTFKGIYEPIWLDAAQTQVNPNNTYATYLYNVVKTYGQYIKFWEVVNEPDFTYSPAGWSGDTNPPTPGSWYDHNPTPAELENLRAPIFYYIRTLRISWEIIKKLSPSSYVCTGGIGYRSFLDAILRNTDNPAGGSVTADYPQKGGAYFDVLSYHCYPMYNIPKTWDNTTASVVQIRHSDAATDAYVNVKKTMDNVLASYGYNNSQFPQKQFICTETGASRIMSGADWGGNEGQKNYMIKAQVASQKAGIKQVYWFQVGDGTNTTAQFDQMGLYTYFGNTSPYYNITKSDQGIAMKTTSDQLYGSTFDVARTYAMALPAGVDGGAFRKNDGSYVYVLWARTTIDLSETASATYSFPSSVVLGSTVDRKEWNYSETNAVSTVPKTGIALTGSPSFFSESGSSAILPPSTGSSGTTTRIQAENWTAMSGVATENAWGDPTGGGLDVGWIDPNDWMDYGFNAPSAGTYTVNFRVASAANGA